jgi:penicillin amidase
MEKFSGILKRVLIVVIIIAVLVGGAGIFYIKSYIPNIVAPKSFPKVNGELHVSGLDGAVDIYRDQMGIPHIYATTVHDLFFAQGYVHAQERFWQMDFWRHIGSGRLSEMFGESQLETDLFLRTMGWRQIAEAEYAALSPGTRAILDAYAEGINAYLSGREPVEISLEYLVLTGILNRDYVIEPWTPIHSLTWGKAMAWDLRGNMGAEIERAILLKTLTLEQVAELFPAYPGDHPVIVSEIGGTSAVQVERTAPRIPDQISKADLQALANRFALLDPVLGPAGPGIGSNSWAVSGKHTNTGMPLLANDPHLGIQMPSIWFQNSLHCRQKTAECPFEVVGFSFAGVPGVVIGHNDKIAWGLTNVGPDVMDLYIEKVNPDNPNQYEYNGEWIDFEIRDEIISIAGSEPVVLTVRSTRHGPVLTDVYGPLMEQVDLEKNPEALSFRDKSGIRLPENYVIALAWTALGPSTPFEAIWGFNTAQNWEDFRYAASHFHVPAQNLLYADVEGNIGYQMPGEIPIRNNGDGRLPVPGWTDEYDWIGFVAFEELPYVLNPDSGYIVTANNQVHSWDYPHLISTDWSYGYRADRIVDMIENAPGKVDIAFFQSMQGDAKNLNAETLVPALLTVDLDTDHTETRDHFLTSWDFQDGADSQAAAVFEWFWWNLLMDTFNDDLPIEYWPEGGSRWYEVMRTLVEQQNSAWWDDKESETVIETRDDILTRAFEETVEQMQKEYGKNLENWPTWGELHTATFRNASLGYSGIGPIEALFNRGPFATSGGEGIVNATGWSLGSFAVDWLPSMRMIVDLGNLKNSITTHTTGESGHAFHPHYIDMAPLWANIEYYPMLWNEENITSNAEGHLRLMP